MRYRVKVTINLTGLYAVIKRMGLSDRTLIAIIVIIVIIGESGERYKLYISIKKISISQLISDGIRDIGSRSGSIESLENGSTPYAIWE